MLEGGRAGGRAGRVTGFGVLAKRGYQNDAAAPSWVFAVLVPVLVPEGLLDSGHYWIPGSAGWVTGFRVLAKRG